MRVNICSEDLSFPNVFSPNSDGKNEVFKALYLGGIYVHEFNLKIYNRWGTLLFESNDPKKGWNGIYRGSVQKTDAFIWHATYQKNSTGQQVVKKGTVTLLR